MAKILLVDDDGDLVMSLSVYLEVKNHSVEVASTGQEGLDMMRSGDHDLIVLDWNLPDIDGIDVLTEYRSSGGTKRILMLTGMREDESRSKGLIAGADDFLSKPFSPSDFIERVKQNVEK
jgi:DNA-binding response OmpR family regulator